MYAQFHVNWDVQRESARNCAYARIDASGFICAQQLSRFWRPQSFSKKSTQVLVHEAPGPLSCGRHLDEFRINMTFSQLPPLFHYV